MRFLRLGVAGMRGEVGSGLTPLNAINFASAFGSWLDGGTVVVGRDTRMSSDMLYNAVVASLLSCGCRVYNADICPAPLLHFAVPHLRADGGLLIGAGHHPANWNAIVPLTRTGAYLNNTQVQELLDIYHARKYDMKKWTGIGMVEAIPGDVAERYLDTILSMVDTAVIAKRHFNVVADFCNGSGSVLAESFSRRLGVNMTGINNELSGILPHDPEPRPRSGFQVKSIMHPLHADAGFIFNSDMSRISVVTNSGETLSEEYTFPLVADHLLARSPRPGVVITNTCTTRTLDDIVARHSGEVIKTKVGQAYIIDMMQEHQAVLGGDGSGSIAAGPVKGYDSFLGVALILEALALNKCNLDKLTGHLPRYELSKKKIPCQAANAYSMLRRLRGHFPDAEVNDEDGIRFDWPDVWIHLRNSSTEPIIRMIVEWNNREDAEERALQMRGIMERLVSS